MEEVVTEIEQRFRDLRRESKDEDEQENVGDDNPSKVKLIFMFYSVLLNN